MQYLSQRLAKNPAKASGAAPPVAGLAADQRQRILDAAERLIEEHGCAGTSIEAIVKGAGVSSVTFYEHFEDKEASFVAAFDRAVVEGGTRLSAAAAGEESWVERVRAALAALVGQIPTQRGRARLCLVEAQTGGALLGARYDATIDAAAARLREGRRLPSAPAELPSTVEEAAVGGIAWLLRGRIEHGEVETLNELLPRLEEIALSPYLAMVAGGRATGG
jgi:AcrR family transcriptional regulator